MLTKKLSIGVIVLVFVCAAGIAAVAQDRDRDRDRDHVTLMAEDEGAGNNLSFPVIWGEDHNRLALRGEIYLTRLEGGFALGSDGLTKWFYQKDADNEWQAENWAVPYGDVLDVTYVDWGDNLEARPWNVNSVVRCETVLYQELTAPAVGFEMMQISGQGVDEMWGTSGRTYPADLATVYSGCANFTIQKLEREGAEVTWNPATLEWEGEVITTVFNGGIGEGGEGPGSYSAEINIPGKVIYGYNWFVRDVPLADKAGVYRLTFSVDPDCAPGIGFDSTYVLPFGEEEEIAQARGGKGGKGGNGGSGDDDGEPSDGGNAGGPPAGGRTGIDHSNNITWIDVTIQKSNGKGGGRR